jgi:hypothetical protein
MTFLEAAAEALQADYSIMPRDTCEALALAQRASYADVGPMLSTAVVRGGNSKPTPNLSVTFMWSSALRNACERKGSLMNKLSKVGVIAGFASVIALGAFAQVTTGDAKGENSPSSSGLSNKSRGAPGVPQGSNIGTGRTEAKITTTHRHRPHHRHHPSSKHRT